MGRVVVKKGELWKAVVRFCVWCMGGRAEDVKYCVSERCRLWVWRLGRRFREGDYVKVYEDDHRILVRDMKEEVERRWREGEYKLPKVDYSKAALWRAIREYCYECVGGSRKEVERCTTWDCPLRRYRLGLRGVKEESDEQRSD